MGVMMPAYREARIAAYMTVDGSNLHQVGLARQLYEQDTDDRELFRIAPLVQGGYLSRPLVVSPLDFTEIGIGNVWLQDIHEIHTREPYKLSFVSVADLHLDFVIKKIQGDGSFGWAASLANGSYVPKAFEPFDGRFLRLSESGAVSVKHQAPLVRIGDHTTQYDSLSPFVDNPEKYFPHER